jgi:tryptophanyl-tRNA synthetase
LSDVSYFLGAGLLPDNRRANERQIVEDYAEALAAYGIDADTGWLWRQYRREAFAGLLMAVTASQVVTPSQRSEALFTVMAARHARHAIDLAALDVI